MPYFPAPPCRHRNCPKRGVQGGFCDEHRKERHRAYNKQRRSDPERNDAFYSSSTWRKLRQAYLREHPLCASCSENGRILVATIVDHRVPIRFGGGPLDWDNLQSQCWGCHSRKSALEGSSWGKRESR